MSLTLPVGQHLFTPEALQKIAEDMVPQLPPDRKIGIGFGVDNEGAKVAVVFQQGPDSHWQAKAAFEHDWTGDTRVGLQGSLTF